MKKTISIFSALAAFAALGVTPNTEWQDVPGTDKVGEVLSAGGAVMTEQDPVWNAQKGGYQPKLVSGTNIKTVNGNSLLGSGNIEIHGGGSTNSVDGAARPLPKYLHALDFDDTYPADAAWYYAQPQDYGSCSAVCSGGFFYRNYDWKFDEASEFVVRMSAAEGRFASVGVANCGTNLTETAVTSGKWSRYYKCLPGRVVDGINENGVVAEVNVVDGDPPEPTGGDIHPLGAVRWALDNGTTAGMVASNLAARIKFPVGWTQNFHWMIADERETWIVENGAASNVTEVAAKRVMTNFQILPDDYEGSGKERYQILRGGEPITNAWFTRAYSPLTSPAWLSDITGLDTNLLFRSWAAKHKEAHRGESFDGQSWWQTVHTSIYDITNRTLRVAVQETDDWYTFAVPSAGGVKPEAVREIVEPMIADATNGLSTALIGSMRGKTDLDVYGDVLTDEWTCVPDISPYRVQRAIDVIAWRVVDTNGNSASIEKGYDEPLAEELTWESNESALEFKFVATRVHGTGPTGDTLATSNGVAEAIAANHDETKLDNNFGKITTSPDPDNAMLTLTGPGDSIMIKASPAATSEIEMTGNDGSITLRVGNAGDPPSIMKNGKEVATEEQVAEKRDLTDNTCRKTEFTEWAFSGYTEQGASYSIREDFSDEDGGIWIYAFVRNGDVERSLGFFNEKQTSFTIEWSGHTTTATRSRVCTSNELFVTQGYVDAKNPGNYAAVSNAAMSAISNVTNADANLIYTITSDGAEPRFYFTPVGAINPED